MFIVCGIGCLADIIMYMYILNDPDFVLLEQLGLLAVWTSHLPHLKWKQMATVTGVSGKANMSYVTLSYLFNLFFKKVLVSNGKRTMWSPVQSAVIKKYFMLLSNNKIKWLCDGSPSCLLQDLE